MPLGGADPDAWRGPVDDDAGEAQASGVDVDAMVANRLAEIDAAGPVERMAPVEVFGPPQQADIIYAALAASARCGGQSRPSRRPISRDICTESCESFPSLLR
jgi:hypothetical protein